VFSSTSKPPKKSVPFSSSDQTFEENVHLPHFSLYMCIFASAQIAKFWIQRRETGSKDFDYSDVDGIAESWLLWRGAMEWLLIFKFYLSSDCLYMSWDIQSIPDSGIEKCTSRGYLSLSTPLFIVVVVISIIIIIFIIFYESDIHVLPVSV